MLLAIRHFHPDEYGAEIQARRLASVLSKQGIDITVLTGRYGKVPRTEIIDEVPVFRHFIGLYHPVIHEFFYLTSLAWQLYLRRREYDIVFLFQAQLSVLVAMLIGKMLGKKIIVRASNTGPEGVARLKERLPLGDLIFRLWASNIDAFVALSKTMIREYAVVGFPTEKCHLIPNGVQVPEDQPIDKRVQWATLEFPMLQDKIVTLYVGRLSKHKGVEKLILSWPEVMKQHPNAHLLLLGDGPLRESLSSQIAHAKLSENINLLGKVANVSEFLKAADLFILPSEYEGMPNALLEAMAHGLPVIASRVSGAQDILKNGRNGVLAELDTPIKIADCINQSIASPEERSAISEMARQTISENYALDVIADRYLELQNSLLN